jgi:hypothetical protein
MTWLLAIRTFLGTRMGKAVAVGIAILIAVVVFNLWLRNERRDAVEADRAASSVEAAAKGRQADEVALARTAREREAVAAQNERARQAADDSDDPLAAALRELRGE